MWWYTRVRPGLPDSEKVAHLLTALGRSPSRRVLLLASEGAPASAVLDHFAEARAALGRRAKGALVRVSAVDFAASNHEDAALWVIEDVHALDPARQDQLEARLDQQDAPVVLTGTDIAEDQLRSTCRWRAAPRAAVPAPTPLPDPENLPIQAKTPRAAPDGVLGCWLIQQASPELTVHLHHLLRKPSPHRERAAALLALLPPQLLRERLLVQLLQSLDPALGTLAAPLIGGLDDPASLDALHRAITRRDPGLRAAVAVALAQRGSSMATRGLRQAEANVRKQTAMALCRWPASTLPVDDLTEALPRLDKETCTVVRRVLGRSEVSEEEEELFGESPELGEGDDESPLGLDLDEDDDWPELADDELMEDDLDS